MEMDTNTNANAIMTNNFPKYIQDLKFSTNLVQDLVNAGQKLQSSLKQTAVYNTSFLECFQKLAEHSKNMQVTNQSELDISSSLAKLVTSQKKMASKLHNSSNILLECFLQPIQIKVADEWKRNPTTIEREHVKDFKRVAADIRKVETETIKLQKKVHKKSEVSCNDSQTAALQVALQDVSQRYSRLERSSRNAMNACHREQAARLLTLITALSPLLESQISLMSEVSQVQKVADELANNREFLTSIVSGKFNSNQNDQVQIENDSNLTDNSSPENKPNQQNTVRTHRRQGSTGSNQTNTSSSNDTNLSSGTSSRHNLVPASNRFSSVSSRDSGFLSQESANNVMQSMPELLPPPPEDWMLESEGNLENSNLENSNLESTSNSSMNNQNLNINTQNLQNSPNFKPSPPMPPPKSQKPPPPPAMNKPKIHQNLSPNLSQNLAQNPTQNLNQNATQNLHQHMPQNSPRMTPRMTHNSKTQTLLRQKHNLPKNPPSTPPPTPGRQNSRLMSSSSTTSSSSVPSTPSLQRKLSLSQNSSNSINHQELSRQNSANQQNAINHQNCLNLQNQQNNINQQHQIPPQSSQFQKFRTSAYFQPENNPTSQSQQHQNPQMHHQSLQNQQALMSHLNNMQVVESGTATIRRRTSTRMPASMMAAQAGQHPFLIRRTPSVHSASSSHLRHNSGSTQHENSDVFSVVSSANSGSGIMSPSRNVF